MGRPLTTRSGRSARAVFRSGGRAAVAPRTLPANVVVVAPHPDDDAIGCGGTLARLAARGAHIAVIYVTDGSASHPGSRRFPPAVLRDVREHEARTALRHLGVRAEPTFLRAPDSGLSTLEAARRAQLAAHIAARVAQRRADIVFAPWPRDPHPDHVATAQLVEAALAQSGRRPAVWYYQVWLPVRIRGRTKRERLISHSTRASARVSAPRFWPIVRKPVRSSTTIQLDSLSIATCWQVGSDHSSAITGASRPKRVQTQNDRRA